jgi:hypothetical protein
MPERTAVGRRRRRDIKRLGRSDAYLQAFDSSAARTQAMRPWLHGDDTTRPLSAHAGMPPPTSLNQDNLHSNDR